MSDAFVGTEAAVFCAVDPPSQADPAPGVDPPMSDAFVGTEAAVFCSAVLLLSILAGDSLSTVFQLVGAVTCSTAQFTMPGILWLHIGKGWSRRPLGGVLLGTGIPPPP